MLLPGPNLSPDPDNSKSNLRQNIGMTTNIIYNIQMSKSDRNPNNKVHSHIWRHPRYAII